MPTLTLKDVPADLHQAFRRRAELNGRSLNKELLASLQAIAFPRQVEPEEFLSRASQLRQKSAISTTTDEILAAVEEGR